MVTQQLFLQVIRVLTWEIHQSLYLNGAKHNDCGVSLDATQTITINSIPDMPYLTGDSTL